MKLCLSRVYIFIQNVIIPTQQSRQRQFPELPYHIVFPNLKCPRRVYSSSRTEGMGANTVLLGRYWYNQDNAICGEYCIRETSIRDKAVVPLSSATTLTDT